MSLKHIIIFLLTVTYSCKQPSEKDPPSSALAIVDTSVGSYYDTIRKLEHASSNKKYTDFGELMNTIEFSVHIESDKSFENGMIPWISIEHGESDLKHLVGASDIVIKEQNVIVLLDYPLTHEYKFEMSSPSGFSRSQLVTAISDKYFKLYDEEENSATIKTVPPDKRIALYNRNQTNGKYGIWGHDIADLILSEISVYKSAGGQITLVLQIQS